ncbi:hypothetical protein CYY_002266 [Polysphondylium violaceum]|uniref:Uncharacterized protein n=1 Tax=Polysphondylium violaceum TaxID=133409 RepID=A0A8J4V9S1_9MYCE|nr:hypothetical protein CYY_002266 [Polysphondylium violaceum]
MSALLLKKLNVLRYSHSVAISLQDRDTFISIVSYLLENYLDNVHSAKELLSSSTDSNWEISLKKFFNENGFIDIQDASSIQDRERCLHFLADQAIKASYKKNSEQIHETKYKCLQTMKFKGFEFDKEELSQYIIKLAKLFNVKIIDDKTKLDNIMAMIIRIAKRKMDEVDFIKEKEKEKETKSDTNNNNNSNNNVTTTAQPTITSTYKDNSKNEIVNNNIFPLGFDFQDDKMNTAATILRLLYVSDLRELQTKINQVLATVQSYTADPQTNFKLGVVGR